MKSVSSPVSSADVSAVILPLISTARSEEAEQRIRQAISLGLLRDGQQLPSEVALAAQMGVSPMTLREALASLREQGLVETRRGRNGGTFIKRPTSPLANGLWSRLRHTSPTALRDLADEHRAIWGSAARLAADRAAEDNVARLYALADVLLTAPNLGARIRADSRFHVDLAAASHSERLMHREVALQSEAGDLLWVPFEPDLEPAAMVAQHRAIVDAIADGDGARARLLAEEHVSEDFRRLLVLHHAAANVRRKK